MLISRKDGKLYVRQNFKPVFDVPVTIAPSDRLLGTHVFTAEVDKNDPNLLRWSVVSLPVAARNAQKNDDDERSSRRRKVAGAVPAEDKAAAGAEQPGRGAGPHHDSAGSDGAHRRSAHHRRLDRGVRPGHQRRAAKPAKARISSFRCGSGLRRRRPDLFRLNQTGSAGLN